MRKRSFRILLILSLTVAPLALAEETVDDIIDKHIEARGGLEKLRAIQSVRLTGRMSLQGHGHGGHGGPDAPITLEFQLQQRRFRMEFEMQGMTGVRAYDGETGWALMPFMGKTAPERLTGDQLEQLRAQADFLGPLVDHEAKGHRVELLGTEEVEGTEAFKLKVTQANGTEELIYLDTEYYLPFRRISKTTMHGQEVDTVITLSNYKEIDGVMFAHSVTTGLDGRGQDLTYEGIELNVPLDEERFRMPVSEAG